MKVLHYITFALLAIGGLNWGLVGAFDLDLVALIFGAGSLISNIVYILVGVSALVEIFSHSGNCKRCKESSKKANTENQNSDSDM
ncbi:MAG: DUF378 domain-containing protein [Candidatus Paceibacterota bacterium]